MGVWGKGGTGAPCPAPVLEKFMECLRLIRSLLTIWFPDSGPVAFVWPFASDGLLRYRRTDAPAAPALRQSHPASGASPRSAARPAFQRVCGTARPDRSASAGHVPGAGTARIRPAGGS